MSARPLGTAALALLALLAGCERTQTMAPARKADTRPWDAGDSRWVANRDWKPGDRAGWERQLAIRAQAQNDYAPRVDH